MRRWIGAQSPFAHAACSRAHACARGHSRDQLLRSARSTRPTVLRTDELCVRTAAFGCRLLESEFARVRGAGAITASQASGANAPAMPTEGEVIDAAGFVDMVDAVFPKAFEDAEIAELLERFDPNKSGKVSLATFKELVDGAIHQTVAEHSPPYLTVDGPTAAEGCNAPPDSMGVTSKELLGRQVRRQAKRFHAEPGQGGEVMSQTRINEISGNFQNDCNQAADSSPTTGTAAVVRTHTRIRHATADDVAKIGMHRLDKWQILYCGGSQPVVDVLHKVASSYGISFRKEKFDW